MIIIKLFFLELNKVSLKFLNEISVIIVLKLDSL